jgi:hypothetical protein
MKYFAGIKTLEELKEKYRNLCKKHHPDLGGDVATMQEINAEYDHLLKTGTFCQDKEEEINEIFAREILEKTTCLEGLIVELCGRWIWFTGATYQHKDILKSIGCFFSRKKTAWYWHAADEKKSRSKGKPLEEIREIYGSKIVTPGKPQMKGALPC